MNENELFKLNSVVNEVTKLGWPGLGNIILVVVPPWLFGPLVEFSGSWGEEPGECLHTGSDNPETECHTNISSHLSTVLGASNRESNESPEGPDPGEWNNPSDGSVVDLLQDSVLSLLNVGEEPEAGKDTEGETISVHHY